MLIKKTIVFLLLLPLVAFAKPRVIKELEITPKPIVDTSTTTWTREMIDKEINRVSAIYQVSSVQIHKIIYCESRYNTKAHNLTSREDSWGLVQINRMAHPQISVEQATDPKFALDFLARNLKAGKGSMWTCNK